MKPPNQRWPIILGWGMLVVLVFSVLVRGGKGLEATWILAGAAVVLTFQRWWTERKHSGRTFAYLPLSLWLALMLFLVLSVLSYAFSTTRNYGLDEVMRDAAFVLIFFWAARATHRVALTDPHAKFTERLITIISAATLLACAVGLAVYVLQPVNRFVGTFFDWRFHTDYWPNAWAEYLLLAWPVIALSMRKQRLWIQIPVLGCVIGCLFLSYSRGAFIVFCGQLFLWALFPLVRAIRERTTLKNISQSVIRIGLASIGSLIIAGAVFIGVNELRARQYDVESVAAKATFTASEGASSISERRDFWSQSFRLSLQKPLLGWGPYSFRFAQPRLQSNVFATSDHPHNVFLKLAMERGWPAALLFAFFLLAVLVPAGLRELRKPSKDLPILIAIAGVLAHNLIDYNLQFVGIALPFWLLLSMLARPVNVPSRHIQYFRTAEIIVAILLGCVTILEGRMLAISSLGRHAETRGDVGEALAWYDRADAQLFSRDMHLSRGALLLQRGDHTGAAAAFERSAQENHEDARLWILRGNLASMDGDGETALAHYLVAFALGRVNYLEPMEGILRIVETGVRPDLKVEKKQEFLAVFHAFGDAILLNTHFIALSESVETFGRVSDLLQKLYPVDRDALRPFTEKVLAHAQEERIRLQARQPGLLW